MTDVLLPLDPADELRREKLQNSINEDPRPHPLVSMHRARSFVALLEAAKDVLEWYQHMPVNRIYNPLEADTIAKVRAAIAMAERETP